MQTESLGSGRRLHAARDTHTPRGAIEPDARVAKAMADAARCIARSATRITPRRCYPSRIWHAACDCGSRSPRCRLPSPSLPLARPISRQGAQQSRQDVRQGRRRAQQSRQRAAQRAAAVTLKIARRRRRLQSPRRKRAWVRASRGPARRRWAVASLERSRWSCRCLHSCGCGQRSSARAPARPSASPSVTRAALWRAQLPARQGHVHVGGAVHALRRRRDPALLPGVPRREL